jgi:hypothetical protein
MMHTYLVMLLLLLLLFVVVVVVVVVVVFVVFVFVVDVVCICLTVFVDVLRMGTLYVTNAMLGFIANEENGFSFPAQFVNTVNKHVKRSVLHYTGGDSSNTNMVSISITLKDFRCFRLSVPKSSDVYEKLSQVTQIEYCEQYFAFAQEQARILGASVTDRNTTVDRDGWKMYVPELEWERQFARCKGGEANWRACVNTEYAMCSTYPKLLMVKETTISTSMFVNDLPCRFLQRQVTM